MTPPRILLVEDNELGRDMLSRRLDRAGYEVITAADGESALGMMREQQPALVLMDMSLPVMDGWSACRSARSGPETLQIPIIALTAHAMANDRQSALAAGCDDFATKPVDFPQLLEKIRTLLPT